MSADHHNIENTKKLVKALCESGQFEHDVSTVETIETHISYVLLTGSFVYKIKKPVYLGFADFSTLAKRKFYCEEEVRLNKRMAPELYLGVIPITGAYDQPELDGKGEAVEYAVKMRQFEQDHQLDRYLKQSELSPDQVNQFAVDIANFHDSLTPASCSSDFASYESITKHASDNFAFSGPCAKTISEKDLLNVLERWTQESLQKNKIYFEQRKRDGFVRECHGDLHLGNLTLLKNRIVAFDCLEFNADLRWIDTVCEIAFFLMDLDYHERTQQGHRFLNKYLEASGDYAGLCLLKHYLTYRAMVRAKVACIKLQQLSDSAESKNETQIEFDRHIELAKHYTKPVTDTPIIITHGFSGCGKTYLTDQLLESVEVIRVRSDIERKRIARISGQEKNQSETGEDLYTSAAKQNVYRFLHELTQSIVKSGYPVIVDATFLQSDDRRMFQELAQEMVLPFVILDITASDSTLKHRINQRLESNADASEATVDVLKYQQDHAAPLSAEEHSHCVSIDSEAMIDPKIVWKSIQTICRRS